MERAGSKDSGETWPCGVRLSNRHAASNGSRIEKEGLTSPGKGTSRPLYIRSRSTRGAGFVLIRFPQHSAIREPHAEACIDGPTAVQWDRQCVLRRNPSSRAIIADETHVEADRRRSEEAS